MQLRRSLERSGNLRPGPRRIRIDVAGGRAAHRGGRHQQRRHYKQTEAFHGKRTSQPLILSLTQGFIPGVLARAMHPILGRIMSEVRKRLESAAFSDLGAMMEGYAQGAVETAHRDFRQDLDNSPESVDILDEILVMVGESPERDLDYEVRLWGSYLGELIRLRYAGSWEMTQYPGGTVAVPAVNVRGSRLFPLMKVYRRLTAGEEEDLRSFYNMVTERLGKPAQVN